jgi:xanthine dehydrogenase accessory factor
MKEIYTKIVELFKKNRVSVLATITRQTGSSPRGVGTKFLIMEDGSFVGTIGGGSLENKVLEESVKVLNSFTPIHLSYRMQGIEVDEAEMTCGGYVEVFLEPVFPDNLSHLQIFEEIMGVIRRGGAGLLATVIDPDQWRTGLIPKMFIKKDGEKIGSLFEIEEIDDSIKERMNDLIEEGKPSTVVCRDREGTQLNIFVEPVISDPVVYIFGGGHVSKQISPLAAKVGFKVVVVDDRPEFSDPVNFPEAQEVHTYSFENVMERFPINEFSYLVIVTRGHSHDKIVLGQALKTSAKYIGMIGSSRKISIIYEKLLKEGFTQDDLDRVHAPIGVEINAETPEEIAVSIVGELIRVRAGG